MGQSGNLAFFTIRRIDPPQEVLGKIIQLTRPTDPAGARRSVGEDNEWERFPTDEYVPMNYFKNVHLQDLPSLYAEGPSLTCDFYHSPLGARVAAAVEADIPPGVRGGFIPSDLYIQIGYHDLWENAEDEDGQLLARAFLSVRFFGYGTPSDWPEFRRRVFELPEVRAVKSELEAVAGPLEQVVYWSV